MSAAADTSVSWRSHLPVFAAYLSLTVILTWPLSIRLVTHVPNDPGDPLLNTWLLWWNTGHVPFTDAWWQAPAFFPGQDVMAFSEHLAGLVPLAAPLHWLGGSPLLTYNVIFLLTFFLSASAAYLLTFELTGRRDAAFLGGLAYGFAPYRIGQLAHLQVLASFWMPLALLGLHRYVRRGGLWWLALFGLCWALQALSNGYYLAFFTVLVALWVVWFVRWTEWRKGAAIAATGALAALAVLPVVVRYRATHARYGFERLPGEIASFGADLTSLLYASPHLTLWSRLTIHERPEGELFPGLGVVLLIAIGLIAARRHWAAVAPAPRLIRYGLGLLFAAVTAGGIAAYQAPWRLEPFGRVLSAGGPERPFTRALILLALLVAASRPMRSAFRSRSPMGFYLLAAALCWLFALGPVPTFFDRPILDDPPYGWLMLLPGFDSLRVPARFGMLMALCLAAGAALGYRWIASATPGRRARRLLLAAFAAILLADTAMYPVPMHEAPPVWDIAPEEIDGAILALPLGHTSDDVVAMYQHMGHGRPLVNGFSGYFPPWYVPLTYLLTAEDPAILDELSRVGVTQVLTSPDTDPERRWQRLAFTRGTFIRRGMDDRYRLFDLPPAPPAPEPVVDGAPIAWTDAVASVQTDLLPRLADGDLRSAWFTGPQTGTEYITLDFGHRQRLAGLRMFLGTQGSDFPRRLVIELSDDRQTWQTAWEGPTALMTFRSAVRHIGQTPLAFPFDDAAGRFLRLRQVERDGVYSWSIAELEVLAPR